MTLLLAAACAAPPHPGSAPGIPAAAPAVEAAGTPLGRSRLPRSGQLTYQLTRVVESEGRARVDLRLHNGTHRDLGSVLLRVVLLGDGGAIRIQPLPIGALRAERARSLTAWIDDVAFAVRDVRLELVAAMP